MRMLANHPEVVTRLSETWPIRRAAQLTAYVFLRGKNAVEEVTPEVREKAVKFTERFREELKRGWDEVKQERKP